MADKLSESTWSSFTKKNKLSLDDAALVKALARLDKAGEDKHAQRLEALEDVVAQIQKQLPLLVKRKKELGDKPFNEAKDKLHELLELAERAQKDTAAAQEDEADSPVLLTDALAKLLRVVLKGETAMPALVALGSKKAALLVLRRSIAPTRRKLLSEYLDQSSGVKYFAGQCTGQGKLLRFEIEGAAGGLAKKLREAVLEQTGLHVKVVVSAGGAEEVEEDEDEGGETNAGPGPGGGDDAARRAFDARRAQVQARVDTALRAQHPEATKLRALLGFVSEKADEKGDFAAAAKALDALEKLLGVAGGPSPTPTPTPTPRPTPTPTQTADFAAKFVPARIALRDAKEEVDAQLGALQRKLREDPDPDFAAIAEFGLAGVTANLMTPLQAALMDVERSKPDARGAAAAKALAAVKAFRSHIETDERVAVCDDNSFDVAVSVRATLTPALLQMEAALQAAA